jgi:hypothetical protein
MQFKTLVEAANKAINTASQPVVDPADAHRHSHALGPNAQGHDAAHSGGQTHPAAQGNGTKKAHRAHNANAHDPSAPASQRPDSESANISANEVGHVLVHVIEAAELDLCGVPAKKLNTYAIVRCGVHKQASHVCKKTADPRWDQKFALQVHDMDTDLLSVQVRAPLIVACVCTCAFVYVACCACVQVDFSTGMLNMLCAWYMIVLILHKYDKSHENTRTKKLLLELSERHSCFGLYTKT